MFQVSPMRYRTSTLVKKKRPHILEDMMATSLKEENEFLRSYINARNLEQVVAVGVVYTPTH